MHAVIASLQTPSMHSCPVVQSSLSTHAPVPGSTPTIPQPNSSRSLHLGSPSPPSEQLSMQYPSPSGNSMQNAPGARSLQTVSSLHGVVHKPFGGPEPAISSFSRHERPVVPHSLSVTHA